MIPVEKEQMSWSSGKWLLPKCDMRQDFVICEGVRENAAVFLATLYMNECGEEWTSVAEIFFSTSYVGTPSYHLF